MEFGFPPKYTQEIRLLEMTAENFLVIAIEAVKKLEWNISYKSETGFVAYTKFSLSSWSEEVTVKIENDIVKLKSECTGSQFIDWGKNKENINRLVAKFQALETSMTPEDISICIQQHKQDLILNGNADLTKSFPKTKISGLFSIFIPVDGYFITPILLNLNILIFIIMAISGVNIMTPDTGSLLAWGANFRPMTLEGEWWRLVTCCFLHIGIFHLLMNMYALLYIGLLLEPYLGKAMFIIAYLLTGILSSLASLYWHDITISAGASGAIFGMYGLFLAMLTSSLINKAARETLLTSIIIFVGYNLLNGLRGDIDNAAHIGGLVGGLIIGYAYIPSLKKPEKTNLKLISMGSLTIVVLISAALVYKTLPNDIGTYDSEIKKFVSFENKALEIYHMPADTPNDVLLSTLKEKGIYNWMEGIKLINKLDSLNLPEVIHDRNISLKKYCDLRIKSYELIYKGIEEDTEQYRDSIENLNKQIQEVVKELK